MSAEPALLHGARSSQDNLRGLKFGNLEQNSAGYVTGFLTVLMMDDKIRKDTSGQKNINDFMSHI